MGRWYTRFSLSRISTAEWIIDLASSPLLYSVSSYGTTLPSCARYNNGSNITKWDIKAPLRSDIRRTYGKRADAVSLFVARHLLLLLLLRFSFSLLPTGNNYAARDCSEVVVLRRGPAVIPRTKIPEMNSLKIPPFNPRRIIMCRV